MMRRVRNLRDILAVVVLVGIVAEVVASIIEDHEYVSDERTAKPSMGAVTFHGDFPMTDLVMAQRMAESGRHRFSDDVSAPTWLGRAG